MTPALLLIGTVTALYVEERGGLKLSEAIALADELGDAVESHTGGRVVLDDVDWGTCATLSSCLSSIRARTGAEDVVLLRFFTGIQNTRLIAEIHHVDGSTRQATLDLPKGVERKRGQLVDFVRILGVRVASVAGDRAPPPAPRGPWAEWLIAGTSGVCAVAAVAFAASATKARNDRAELGRLPDSNRYDELMSRISGHSQAAGGLAIAAAVGLTVSVAIRLAR